MPTITGYDVSPNVVQGSPLDVRELISEFYFGESARFRLNTSIKRNWPTPGVALVANSNAIASVDIDGRYTHTLQVTGISATTGDTLVIQACLDGTTWVTLPASSIATSPIGITTIIANGLYNLPDGNYWKIQAVVTPGATTGTTFVTLMSKS